MLHPWEFKQYSFDEYCAKRNGYFEYFRQDKMIDFDHLRLAISQLMRIQVDKKYQNKPIETFIPDIYNRKPLVTREDEAARVKRIMDKAKNIKIKKKVHGE